MKTSSLHKGVAFFIFLPPWDKVLREQDTTLEIPSYFCKSTKENEVC